MTTSKKEPTILTMKDVYLLEHHDGQQFVTIGIYVSLEEGRKIAKEYGKPCILTCVPLNQTVCNDDWEDDLGRLDHDHLNDEDEQDWLGI